MTERLVAGMVGGGPGAMIGAAHRHAMWLDNQYVLAAGIFGRNAQASAEFAQSIGVERVYNDYREMAEQEAGNSTLSRWSPPTTHSRSQGVPRSGHLGGVGEAIDQRLEHRGRTGCDRRVQRRDPRCPPHIYSAYAMVRHAARMVRNGDLGRVRFVAAEHASGWASDGSKNQWRMDPDIGGTASAVGDVGTHAFHLLRYIAGLEATRVSAELSTLVGRASGVRQRDHAAHAVQRRACNRVGDDGGHRPRARPAHSGVRRRREPGMAPRRSTTPARPRSGRRHDDSRAGHGHVVR